MSQDTMLCLIDDRIFLYLIALMHPCRDFYIPSPFMMSSFCMNIQIYKNDIFVNTFIGPYKPIKYIELWHRILKYYSELASKEKKAITE